MGPDLKSVENYMTGRLRHGMARASIMTYVNSGGDRQDVSSLAVRLWREGRLVEERDLPLPEIPERPEPGDFVGSIDHPTDNHVVLGWLVEIYGHRQTFRTRAEALAWEAEIVDHFWGRRGVGDRAP